MDCAGNVALMVLAVEPPAGGVAATEGIATIDARLALLYWYSWAMPVDEVKLSRVNVESNAP